ncbi:MAG: hypothetical protein KGM17_14480 [Sphingomonadales bacterium]|nr:hypothetical protein [Sphingomonadales bacterium]
MRPLSILVLLQATLLAPAPAAPAPMRLVLFGAVWCAPCRAELRNLPALAGAAAPQRITLAWIDRPALPTTAEVAQLPPAQAARLARELLGEGYGLPAAVMLDAGGRACAVLRAPLTPAAIAGLRKACTAG